MDQEQSPLLQVKSTVHHLYLYISTTTFVAKKQSHQGHFQPLRLSLEKRESCSTEQYKRSPKLRDMTLGIPLQRGVVMVLKCFFRSASQVFSL